MKPGTLVRVVDSNLCDAQQGYREGGRCGWVTGVYLDFGLDLVTFKRPNQHTYYVELPGTSRHPIRVSTYFRPDEIEPISAWPDDVTMNECGKIMLDLLTTAQQQRQQDTEARP